MANFRIFNVQLLPNTVNEGDVGLKGYKTLFASLRDETKRARSERRLLAYHSDVGRDAHFGPAEFHPAAGYVWGYFVRYKRTQKVDDLNTGRELFKEKRSDVGIAAETKMLFIFDCRNHFLAIEEAGNALPPSNDFLKILDKYLRPLANRDFPNHELHIILMSDKNSLDSVLNRASGFSRIEIDLTFPNGEAENTLEEVKRARIQKLKILSSPGKDGEISKNLPGFMMEFIQGSIKFGRTQLSYFEKSLKENGRPTREKYDSASSPMKFEKRKTSGEGDVDFARRCLDELRSIIQGIPAGDEPEDDDTQE